MDRINYLMLICIIIISLAVLFVSNQHDDQNIREKTFSNSLKPFEISVLGGNNNGTVIKTGPYGNSNSTWKIAFIVGVHPLEQDSHKAIFESVLNLSKALNSTYYIYSIDVTKDRDSYDKGRMNGQILAKEYVVPDMEKNNFNLAVDVHSNRGGNFQKTRFLFVPGEDDRSMAIASNIISKIPWLEYYIPPKETGPTSPNYVTIPLIKSGIPAIIYETYRYEPYNITAKNAEEFVLTVDNLKLK